MTFTIKVRGGTGLVLAEYLCPLHGRFELLVERDANGDPPAEQACPAIVPPADAVCWESSPWTISAPAVHTQFVVTASKGKNAPKPHPRAMDQRMLAEGRKNDFRKQRKKIKEEERHARVKRLLS
jgi:hypothetical protein